MKTIAVIFGGRSTEHDVSIVTAISSVIKPLESTGQYQVEPVYISKEGNWYLDRKLCDIKLYQSGEIDDFLSKTSKIHILIDNGLVLVKGSSFAGRKQYKKIDLVFPAMHGTYGEDGDLMGLLEMANVPYVGCGVAASAVAMDKVLSKQVTQSQGIPSTPWVWFHEDELARSTKEVLKRISALKYPIFVKPASGGSSIGITKVKNKEELVNALEVAVHFDNKVIVEQAVENLIEVTLPIIGNGEAIPALLERPILSNEDFFDFEAKYVSNGKGNKTGGGKKGSQGYSEIPADLPKDIYDATVEIALDVYRAVGCTGISRIDMLIDSKAKKIMFNEINPLPGDLYAHNWVRSGTSKVELVTQLVKYAEDRWIRKQKLQTGFSTNYLKQF